MFNLNYNLIRFLEIKEAKNIRMPSVEILMILAKQKKCGATEGNEAPKRRRSLRRANERSKKRGRPGVAPPRCAHPFAIDLSAFRLFFWRADICVSFQFPLHLSFGRPHLNVRRQGRLCEPILAGFFLAKRRRRQSEVRWPDLGAAHDPRR